MERRWHVILRKKFDAKLVALALVTWSLNISAIRAQSPRADWVNSGTTAVAEPVRFGSPTATDTPSLGNDFVWQDSSRLAGSTTPSNAFLQSPQSSVASDESKELRPFWQNLAIYAGLDGSRGPEDLGVNANMGFRVGFQTAFPIIESWGIGFQLGTSYDNHENATRFIRLNGGSGDSSQIFSTIGIFQRIDCGLSWGIAYDYLAYEGWAGFAVAQWRGEIAYLLDRENEIGIWGTYRDRGDTASFAGETFSLRAINQVNFFWSHYWPTQAMTSAWAGFADNHGEVILGVPNSNARRNMPFVFGAKLQIPLNDNLALFGEANFITPNDSGTVTAFLGIVYYPGGNAAQALRNAFAPLMTLANNPNFAVDVRR